MPGDTHTLRVPRRVISHILEGSPGTDGAGSDPATDQLVGTLRTARVRKDGSSVVTVDEGEADVLREYAGYLREAARDGVAWEPGDCLADIRAADAVINALRLDRRAP